MKSISYLLGPLAYVAAKLRSRVIATAPLVMYAVGAVPASLRAFVSEAALDLGLVTMARGRSRPWHAALLGLGALHGA